MTPISDGGFFLIVIHNKFVLNIELQRSLAQ
jgi:hypothetical protein